MSSALATWLDERSSAALAFGAVRLATMGLAWYLLATTLSGLLARIAGSTRWSEAADFISPRLVRRLLQGAAGMTVAASGDPEGARAEVDSCRDAECARAAHPIAL